MCYSALVNQHVKKLGLTYQARIQTDLFEDLFKFRLQGSGAKIPRAMEAAFLEAPKSAAEIRIEKYIREFNAMEIQAAQKDLFAQSKRLADAERTLLSKVTKKAQNDQRISTDKIARLETKIERLKSTARNESDSRIFPGNYAPLVTVIDGERVVAPFRYLLRPKGQPVSFDRQFEGCYNARRDSLQAVFWWKSIFGRNHGILEMKCFWENVKLSDFEHRKPGKNEEDKNMILKFAPKGLDHLLVPCLFDFNTEGQFPLFSFALITDEPNPEVAAAGHGRTPIIMKKNHLDQWLTPGLGVDQYEILLSDKESTYFEHEIAA